MSGNGRANRYQAYESLTEAEVQEKVGRAERALFDVQQALAWAKSTRETNIWHSLYLARIEVGRAEQAIRRGLSREERKEWQ